MRFKKKIFTALAGIALFSASHISAIAADHKVSITGFKFAPASISVAVGDTITFTNEDGAPHTATASNGSFDSGRLGKGASKQITISSAGEISYKCAFHPSMKGTVSAK